jgi:glycosyltransferase involved in cell wall biosynthesis
MMSSRHAGQLDPTPGTVTQGVQVGRGGRDDRAISVIIPTWNEAPWLGTLLDRLAQCPNIAEVVVADHGSIDGTREIAAAHGCVVIEGGRPATGRNAGARVSHGDLLLFVDADVAVTPRVVTEILAAFANPDRMLVHLRLVPATERRFIRLCYRVVHLYAALGAKLRAHQGSAPLICVRREAFFAIEGFDERVAAAEDVDLIRRVRRRCGGVAYLPDTPLVISVRRFETESHLMYVVKCIVWAALRSVGLRVSIWPYAWTGYSEEIAQRDQVIARS